MKNIFISLLLISVTVKGQDSINLNKINNIVTFESIVPMDNVTKDEIHSRAKLWVINYFKSAKDVISAEDKELGIIKGTGIMNTNNGKMQFRFTINVKDGKYKYSFYDIYYLDQYGGPAVSLDYYYDYYKDGKKFVRKKMTSILKDGIANIDEMVAAMKIGLSIPTDNSF